MSNSSSFHSADEEDQQLGQGPSREEETAARAAVEGGRVVNVSDLPSIFPRAPASEASSARTAINRGRVINIADLPSIFPRGPAPRTVTPVSTSAPLTTRAVPTTAAAPSASRTTSAATPSVSVTTARAATESSSASESEPALASRATAPPPRIYTRSRVSSENLPFNEASLEEHLRSRRQLGGVSRRVAAHRRSSPATLSPSRPESVETPIEEVEHPEEELRDEEEDLNSESNLDSLFLFSFGEAGGELSTGTSASDLTSPDFYDYLSLGGTMSWENQERGALERALVLPRAPTFRGERAEAGRGAVEPVVAGQTDQQAEQARAARRLENSRGQRNEVVITRRIQTKYETTMREAIDAYTQAAELKKNPVARNQGLIAYEAAKATWESAIKLKGELLKELPCAEEAIYNAEYHDETETAKLQYLGQIRKNLQTTLQVEVGSHMDRGLKELLTSYGQQFNLQLTRPEAIKPPKYRGEVSSFFEFKTAFESAIGSLPIPPSVKLHHLKSALEGPPKGVISSLKEEDGNYETAWGLLETRFGNRELIKNKLLNEIMNTKPAKDSSLRSTRELHDKLKLQWSRILQADPQLAGSHEAIRPMIEGLYPLSLRRELKKKFPNDPRPEIDTFLTRMEELLNEEMDLQASAISHKRNNDEETGPSRPGKKNKNGNGKRGPQGTSAALATVSSALAGVMLGNGNGKKDFSKGQNGKKKGPWQGKNGNSGGSNGAAKSQFNGNKNGSGYQKNGQASGFGPRKNANLKCWNCKQQGHGLYTCMKFKKLSYDEKRKKLTELSLCHKCLKGDHLASHCQAPKKCNVKNQNTGQVCGGSHPSLLHKK